MKWANIDKQINVTGAEKKFFQNLTSPTLPSIAGTKAVSKAAKHRKALIKAGFKLLVKYPNKTSPTAFECGTNARRKYEVFCGGFLYFYDVELGNYASNEKLGKKYKNSSKDLATYLKSKGFKYKSGRLAMDHSIGFVWNEAGTTVEVYLKPGQTKNPDPPSTPSPPPPETSE